MGIICMFVAMTGLLLIYKVEKRILYHGVVFNFIWGLSAFISTLGLYNLEIPSDRAYGYVLIGIVSYNFSYFFARMFSSIGKNNKEKINNINRYRNFVTILSKKKFITLQVITILMMIPYIKRALLLNVGTDLNMMRSAIYATEDNAILTSGRDSFILFTVLLSLIIASMIITTYMFFTKQVNWKIILLCLIQVLMYSWVTGGRSLFLRGIIFILFGSYFLGEGKFILTRRMKRFLYMATIILIGTLIISTNMRSSYYNEGIFFWVVVYLTGPLIYMSKILELTSFGMVFSYGSISFGGLLYYPIYYSNKFLGTDFIPATIKLSFLDEPINIREGSISLMYNALGSSALNFYYDFGVFGIILGFMALGFISTIMYIKSKKKKDLITISALLLLCYCVVFSILRWEPVTIWIWGSFFVIILANIILREKVGDEVYEKNHNN